MTLSKEQLRQLQLLNICPLKLRKQLLEKISLQCIKAICECCVNTLKGNIPLTVDQKKSLSKYKGTIRTLADRKITLFKKRKLVVQKGGFLGILLPVALNVLSGIINGIR